MKNFCKIYGDRKLKDNDDTDYLKCPPFLYFGLLFSCVVIKAPVTVAPLTGLVASLICQGPIS